MVDTVTEFQSQIEQELDKQLTQRARRVIIAGVRAAYNHIQDTWPKHTYFSGANNRISITGRPVSLIQPTRRPTRRGALAQKFASVTASELSKLNNIPVDKKDRLITIGNAVDYAPDVGFKPGQGIAIYATAVAIAQAVMRKEG